MHTTLMYVRYLDNDENTPGEDTSTATHGCDIRVAFLVHSEEALHLPYQSLTYDTVSMILKYQATDFEVISLSGSMIVSESSGTSYFIPTGTRLYPYTNDAYDDSTAIWPDEVSDEGYILDIYLSRIKTVSSGIFACDLRIASTNTIEVQNVHAGTSRMVTTSGAGCKVPYKVLFEEIPEQQEIPEYEPYVPYVHPWRNPNMDCYNYNGDPTVSCDSSHIGTSGSFIQSGECV